MRDFYGIVVAAFGMDDVLRSKESKKIIHRVLSTLTHREYATLILRYEVGYTLKKVGECLGLSISTIAQTETRAFRKLRHPSRSKILKQCLG